MPKRHIEASDMHLTYSNRVSWLETIWLALDEYNDSQDKTDETEMRWDDICTAMSWIADEMGVEYDTDGDMVYVGVDRTV